MASTIRLDGGLSWSNRVNLKAAYTDIGALQTRATTLEAFTFTGVAKTVTTAAAAGGSNVCEVTFTVKDGTGATVAAVHHMDVYLSDAATGAGLTATTASGAVAVKANSGVDLATLTSKKALRVQTLATGVYILSITDTSKTAFYPCAVLGSTSKAKVGTQLITGNYG